MSKFGIIFIEHILVPQRVNPLCLRQSVALPVLPPSRQMVNFGHNILTCSDFYEICCGYSWSQMMISNDFSPASGQNVTVEQHFSS